MEELSYYVPLILLPLLVLLIVKRLSSAKSSNLPPAPPSLPLIGHLHLIKNAFHLTLTSLSRTYGPIYSLRLGFQPYVVVSSPALIEECFTKNDLILAYRPLSMAADWLTYNYTTLAAANYGHVWRVLRKLSVVEMFSTQSLQKSGKLREEEARMLVRVLDRAYQNGGRHKVDLKHLASTYTFNIMMKTLAGKRCVEEEDVLVGAGKEAVVQIRETFTSSLAQGICDFFPVLRWIGYKGMEKKLKSMHKDRDQILQNMVDEIRAKTKSNGSSYKKDATLIEALLALQASEPDFYTDDIVKSLVVVMLIAGTETSAVTMEWAMSLLLTHPDEMRKLKQEIDANIGHDHLITDADLAKIPHLRYVVNETLRMYPPVPLLIPHYASEECTVGGYTIPKNTTVFVNAWGVHRDSKVWDEPEKFNPDRFRAMELETEGHKFVPFGMGRRACPGSGMAVRMLSLILGAFVQCFEWEKVEGEEHMDANYQTRVTLPKSKALEAMCNPRREAAHILSLV